ncbi:MAG: hypothetical protein RLZZ584_2725 [Pseudomonadota bacterium]
MASALPAVLPCTALAALEWTDAPMWVFDLQGKRMRWANAAGLVFWHAGSLAEFLARDFSDISPSTVIRNRTQMDEHLAGRCGRDQWTVYPCGQPTTLNAHTIGIDLADGTRAILYEASQVSTPLDASVLRGVEAMQQTPLIIALHRMADGSVVMRNPSAVHSFGIVDASVRRDDFAVMFADRAMAESALSSVRRRQTYTGEAQLLTLSGAAWYHLDIRPVPDPVSGAPMLQLNAQDITARKQAEARLQLAASVFEHAREGIMITDARQTIIDVNDAFVRITGYSREESIGRNPGFLSSGRQDKAFYAAMWAQLNAQGHWAGEIWNRRKDSEVIAELLTISSVRDASGSVQQYVALFSDITTLKQHQSQLEHMAHFDALTSLPNRVLLADRLHQAMAHAVRRGQHLVLAYLDLDGFKAINDQHGHDVGDQVLVSLACRMQATLRESDSLARLGGDEFVAMLIDLQDASACLPLVTRLLTTVAQPILAGELTVQVSASVGLTFYPQHEDIDADQLLRQADQAMYQAKLAGKNRFHFFDTVQDSSARIHHGHLERIRLALAQDEFVLHYQPKVNMRTGAVVGVEALIRWQHPDKGLLSPDSFLTTVENDPLAVAIGEWVIDTALTQVQSWLDAGLTMPVSVNVGAIQLQRSDFVERLRGILLRHPGLGAGSLGVEVLETSALGDIPQVAAVIEACADMGVTFALDDFGTGYSSLTYLKRLRVDMLKIDQSFVRDMLVDPDDLAILKGVIGLAAAFRRNVIAEGVETRAHGQLLLQLGCELAQGFGIAHPMPAGQLPSWVASWQTGPGWMDVAP